MWNRGLPGPLSTVFERHAEGFPAVAAGVFTPDQVWWEARGIAFRGPGAADGVGEPVPMDAASVFDLASLTKALATAPAVFALATEGLLRLDDPPVHALPWADGPLREHLESVPLWRLLNHSAGLAAYAPFFQTCDNREALLLALGRVPPERAPGAGFLYSDLGYILLGHHLTCTLGEDWTSWAARTFYAPLGLDFSFWGRPPGTPDPGATSDVAAMACNREPSGAFGGRVHDENARVLGSWCGHAGLFGSLSAVIGWLQALYAMRNGRPGGPLPPEAVRRMWTPMTPGDAFTPGWDRPAPVGFTTAGDTADREATVGHLGFSGTACWLHPPTGRGGVLLTNRVSLGRHARMDELRAFRSEFFAETWRTI